jgi:SAM-dependent methyltransferase
MDQHTRVNRMFWDEIAPLHAASDYYRIDGFLKGADMLGEPEVTEVGDVTGKRLAHLMCHLGLDSLSWVRRGAQVTGVDFAPEAIRIADRLAEQVGLDATFVCADVARAAELLGRGTFDIVFLSRGILMWIGDLGVWAKACAELLKPGGVFYLLDIHPVAMTITRSADGVALQRGYFASPDPTVVVEDGSYAISDAGLDNQETHEWIHPLGDVVTALIGAGIRIEFLHEFPADDPDLPALFSIRGTRR